jgi:hypothetical protein
MSYVICHMSYDIIIGVRVVILYMVYNCVYLIRENQERAVYEADDRDCTGMLRNNRRC